MTATTPRLPADVLVFERGWLSSNNVLLHDTSPAGAVLVDSGYATHAAQTVELVARALDGTPLGRIFNTHLHSDHCGGNAALAQRFGCSVYVPAAQLDAVRRWDPAALTFAATGQHCPRFDARDTLAPGQRHQIGRREWQVLGAPGHDPHSLILYAPEERLLISADALWANGFGVVFPEIDGSAALQEVRETLDLIGGLDVRAVIPGHGPVFSDVAAALERAYRRLEGFERDPQRHGWYAAKALTKFHLIEVRRAARPRLFHWLQATPLLSRIHSRYFGGTAFDAWCESLLDELIRAGAATMDGGDVVDI